MKRLRIVVRPCITLIPMTRAEAAEWFAMRERARAAVAPRCPKCNRASCPHDCRFV